MSTFIQVFSSFWILSSNQLFRKDFRSLSRIFHRHGSRRRKRRHPLPLPLPLLFPQILDPPSQSLMPIFSHLSPLLVYWCCNFFLIWLMFLIFYRFSCRLFRPLRPQQIPDGIQRVRKRGHTISQLNRGRWRRSQSEATRPFSQLHHGSRQRQFGCAERCSHGNAATTTSTKHSTHEACAIKSHESKFRKHSFGAKNAHLAADDGNKQ
jgi:hypothetical protein